MTSDESDAVMLTTKGNVAIITLNKPRKLNAMTRDQFWKVAEYLREVAERDDILFTVLTGRGRFFSAYVYPKLLHFSIFRCRSSKRSPESAKLSLVSHDAA